MTGFLTEAIVKDGSRVGFQGRTLDGGIFRLAHVDIGGPFRLGPYGVDVAALEDIGLGSLRPTDPATLVVLDEVGKMESFSPAFREAVGKVRHDPRIELLHMSRVSRAAIVGDILRALGRHGIGAALLERRGSGTPP